MKPTRHDLDASPVASWDALGGNNGVIVLESTVNWGRDLPLAQGIQFG